MSAPDVTLPDVTVPAVTTPNNPQTTSAPLNDAPAADPDQSDDGLGALAIALLVLLALGIVGTVVALMRSGRDSSDDEAQKTSRLYANLNRLIDDGNWAMRQAAEALSLIHISEPTRLLSISYAVFCLKKKKPD